MAKKTRTLEYHAVTIEVPVAEYKPQGYEAIQAASGKVRLSRHLQLHLGEQATMGLGILEEGMERAAEKTADGKPVKSRPLAVQCFLEKVVVAYLEEIAKESGKIPDLPNGKVPIGV